MAQKLTDITESYRMDPKLPPVPMGIGGVMGAGFKKAFHKFCGYDWDSNSGILMGSVMCGILGVVSGLAVGYTRGATAGWITLGGLAAAPVVIAGCCAIASGVASLPKTLTQRRESQEKYRAGLEKARQRMIDRFLDERLPKGSEARNIYDEQLERFEKLDPKLAREFREKTFMHQAKLTVEESRLREKNTKRDVAQATRDMDQAVGRVSSARVIQGYSDLIAEMEVATGAGKSDAPQGAGKISQDSVNRTVIGGAQNQNVAA